ncbi:MAG: prepilin peptidase [Deltaproteobacteria bacterium]|jgi:leader peptidase (prepilin peptidase)/N-methyltransferase|nr:prepilin peptidase [Deltaproteobacteria bacterium]
MNMLLLSQILAISLVVAAAAIDYRQFRLPHWLTWPAAIIVISGQALWGNAVSEAALGAAFGFGIMKGAQVWCRWRHKKECLGSGDAFLMLSLGALLGPVLIPWGIACATILATLATRFGIIKLPLAFGPFLVAGCLVLMSFSALFT